MRVSAPGVRGDLARRLADAEAMIEALLAGQIDAVVDTQSGTPVLLSKAQEALRMSEAALRSERDRAVRAAAALRTAEERTRFALETAGVGIWDMNYSSGVIKWSETSEGHYGLKPGTFDGTFESFVERIHPDDRAAVLETIDDATKSGADFTLQHRVVWPDGTVRRLNGAGRFKLGAPAEPVLGVGISLDVTDRRALEEQIQQSQKMEAVGRLAGGVAHDFNNLLMVITGFSELLLQGLIAGDSRREDVRQIRDAATAAASLTRQLLAFSRQQVIKPAMIDFETLVSASVKLLRRLIGEDIELVMNLDAPTATVHMDPGQLEQVVMNLTVNARDAMPIGGKLTIGTSTLTVSEKDAATLLPVAPGHYAVLTTSDTGVGMDEMTRRRIFEPFFTTKDQGKGTGLGLATVYGIVKQADGFIRVLTQPGKGSTFEIYLPLFAGAADAGVADQEEASPRGGETILLVEDSEGVRNIARRVLEKQGYQVIEAPSASAALNMARGFNETIHLLLTDVVMPEMSGALLAERFSMLYPQVKLLFMSGYTDELVNRHGVLSSETPYLQKPFTPNALASKVREVLDG